MMEKSSRNAGSSSDGKTFIQDLSDKLTRYLAGWHVALLIFFLALVLKIWSMDPISNWDETWLADIAAIMAERGNWLYPLYSGEGGLKLFDKPPLVFWIVAFFILIFGRTTLAIKFPLAVGSACSALAGYLFFSHFQKSRKIGVIVGTLMAVTFFYNFYARTAYLDAFIYGLSALLGVTAIKAIDAHYKEDNRKKTIVYLFLTWIMLTMNILAKAWQGFLVLPAVAFYLLVRHLETIYEWESYRQVFTRMKTDWLTPKFRDERAILGIIAAILVFLVGVIVQVPIQLIILNSLGVGLGIFAFTVVLAGNDDATKQEAPNTSSEGTKEVQGVSNSRANSHFDLMALLKDPTFQKMLVISIFLALLLGSGFQFMAKLLYSRFERPVFELLPNAGNELQLTFLTDPFIIVTILAMILGLPLALLGFLLSGYLLLGLLGILNVEPRHRTILVDVLRLIPLMAVGGWLGIWTVFFLLGGLFFNRDALSITIVGVIGFLSIILLTVDLPRWLLDVQADQKLNLPSLRSFLDILLSVKRRGDKHVYFTAIFGILVILSVFPFVAWIQLVDSEVVNAGKYDVRIPGELFKDPNRPDKLNYSWLFFDYYVGWRYVHGTTYDLYSQFRSAIGDPVLILTFPFFLVGLYVYFFGRRDEDQPEIAQGAFFLTWLFTILFFFLPAIFQLNYYYLGIFLPYYGIAGKGLYHSVRNKSDFLKIKDPIEEILLIAPLLLLVFLTEIPDALNAYIFTVTPSLENFLFDDGVWRFVIFTFLYQVGVKKYVRDIPSIFSYGATLIYILTFNIHLDWLAFYIRAILPFTVIEFSQIQLRLEYVYWLGDPILTILGLIIVSGTILTLKTRVSVGETNVSVGGLIIIILLSFAGISTVSGNVAVNDILSGQFENIAHFILTHGGDYNYSTWVFPDAGTTGAMRYYLGYEVVQGHNNHPFSTNRTSDIERYFQRTHPGVAFWIVTNRSHAGIKATSDYSAAYRWLKENMVLADDQVGLNPDGTFHFFYNATKVQELMQRESLQQQHPSHEFDHEKRTSWWLNTPNVLISMLSKSISLNSALKVLLVVNGQSLTWRHHDHVRERPSSLQIFSFLSLNA